MEKNMEKKCKCCGEMKNAKNEYHRNDPRKTICKDCLKHYDMYDPSVFVEEGYPGFELPIPYRGK
jgi:hypothetical protein